MALIPEDGTGVTDANSYVSLADARSYCADRGLSLPTDDTEAEQALVRGCDYVDTYRDRFQGYTTYGNDQELQFPRTGVYIDGWQQDVDAIPAELVAAQILAAVEIGAGTDLMPTGTPSPVKRERVGPLETEYETSGGRGSIKPQATAVEALLRPLLARGGIMGVARA